MMTPQEHTLMISMFATQGHDIQILFELLKSHEIIDASETDAFEFVRRADPIARAQMIDAVAASYFQKAKSLAVHLGISELPT